VRRFISATIDQNRDDLVHMHIGNKIAFSRLIDTITSVDVSMHRLRSDCISSVIMRSKARPREMSNKRGVAEWEERWGNRWIGIGRIWDEGQAKWELNKCLPAEICVPIFESRNFREPQSDIIHLSHSSLSLLVRLICSSIFSLLDTLAYNLNSRKFPNLHVFTRWKTERKPAFLRGKREIYWPE